LLPVFWRFPLVGSSNINHHNTIVAIDDCDLWGGGKGKKAIDYMLIKNWFVHTQAYQVLLLHKESSILGKKIPP
jgi:hypothetical protein